MKTAIVSYSFTGNNNKIADELSKTMNARHFKIEDKRSVTVKSIMLDLVFHRRQKNTISPDILKDFDHIIYLAPFWVGKIARPLLPFLKSHKRTSKDYSFITVSGGALGKNSKHHKELLKRTGKKPHFTKEFYTVDMVNKEEANMKDTSTYLLTDSDVSEIIKEIMIDFNKYNVV